MKTYEELDKEARSMGHRRFCAPLAVALVTELPFAIVHHKMMVLGARRDKLTGASYYGIMETLSKCGASFKTIPTPVGVKTNITLEGRLDKTKKYLIHYRGHIAAYVNGKLEDHTVGSRHRVREIIEVTCK